MNAVAPRGRLTPVSTARSLPRSRAWLRALVLLLALLVPGTPAETHTTPVAASVAGPVETTAEYDVLDPPAALRPPSLTVHRATAPLRPAPAPASGNAVRRHLPAPHGPSYTLRAQRTVVLRC
jgi:hypothetical protein